MARVTPGGAPPGSVGHPSAADDLPRAPKRPKQRRVPPWIDSPRQCSRAPACRKEVMTKQVRLTKPTLVLGHGQDGLERRRAARGTRPALGDRLPVRPTAVRLGGPRDVEPPSGRRRVGLRLLLPRPRFRARCRRWARSPSWSLKTPCLDWCSGGPRRARGRPRRARRGRLWGRVSLSRSVRSQTATATATATGASGAATSASPMSIARSPIRGRRCRRLTQRAGVRAQEPGRRAARPGRGRG